MNRGIHQLVNEVLPVSIVNDNKVSNLANFDRSVTVAKFQRSYKGEDYTKMGIPAEFSVEATRASFMVSLMLTQARCITKGIEKQ